MALLKQDVHFPPAVFPRSARTDAHAPSHEDAVLARATVALLEAGAIRSARLVLRAPQPADAETIAQLANDRRIAENTSRLPYPYTLAHAQEWIGLTQSGGQTTAPGKFSCGKAFLVTRHDGTIVGGCGYGMLLEPVNEIGYWFGVPHWGQGYATEAARSLIDHIFETEGDDVIAAGARVTNTASRHVIEKCGFAWTGARLMRVRALATSVPIDRFRLTREQWERQRTPSPPLQAG
jgi:RimJ/RimL family protein N-acetyltransferase